MTKYYDGGGNFIGEDLQITFWRREDSESSSSNGEIVASLAGKPPQSSMKTQHALGGGWVDYRPATGEVGPTPMPFWNGEKWGHINRQPTAREARIARGY